MRLLFLLLLLISFLSQGQTARFRNELKRVLLLEDSVWAMDPQLETGTDEISFTTAVDLVRENVLAICQDKSNKTQIDESYTLKRMAHTCGKFFRTKKFSKKDKMFRLNREVRRLKRTIITRYGIVEVFSFTIPIYDKNRGRYFYDRKGPEGDPNLYKGNKKRLKRQLEEDEELEYEHIDGLTFEKINEEIERQLTRKRILSNLKKGYYSFVGIDAQINKRTNRKQLPEVRVVLFFGARRLHHVKTSSTS